MNWEIKRALHGFNHKWQNYGPVCGLAIVGILYRTKRPVGRLTLELVCCMVIVYLRLDLSRHRKSTPEGLVF
jgi:hypothetical protein